MDEKEDPLFKLSEAALARRKAVFELRELQRKDRPENRAIAAFGVTVPLLTGVSSLVISLVSLYIAYNTSVSQVQKTRSELEAGANKQFADLVQSASDPKRGPGERIASILLLRPYWGGRASQAYVLAYALCNIIANEENVGVMDACSKVLCSPFEGFGSRYSNFQDNSIEAEKSDIAEEAFFNVTHSHLLPSEHFDRGIVLLAMDLGRQQSNDSVVLDRMRYLGRIIEEAPSLSHLNLSRGVFWALNLEHADLSYSLLHYSYMQNVHLKDANLSSTDLSNAYLTGADLRNANLSKANLRLADLSGAKLQDANLEDADLEGAVLHDESELKLAKGRYKGKPQIPESPKSQ